MTHTTPITVRRITRRAAITATGTGLGGAAIGLRSQRAVAVEDGDFASHPMAGTWLVLANPPLPEDPQVPGPARLDADGSFLGMFPVSQRGPQGTIFNTPYIGVWEPDGERRAHFTAVQVLSDTDGAFTGTITVDGYPEASEDGQHFSDDGSRVMVTIRDVAGAIVEQFMPTGEPAGRAVTGVRMTVGNPGFADGSAATPTA